ncbi:MAG: hypothetical protein HFJ10_07520 [Lachnospiraceae bacterium]|jgi:hypothetical protein|nr:hypothetical protein [Lachnospiraceae bacterium]
MEEQFKVKTLGKALRVLECFNVHTPELGITDIEQNRCAMACQGYA